MSGLNRVMIIGNLGRNPEVTYTQSGVAVAKIAVATSETWNDKNTGEKRENTEWHRITFFGKQAETIGKYMAKGSQIYVEGRLQTSQYEKDGITLYSTDIIANNFQFIGGKKQDQQQAPPQQNQGGFQNTQGQQQQNQGGFQQNTQNTQQQAPPQQQNNGNQNDNQGFQNQTGGQAGFQGPPDDDIPF